MATMKSKSKWIYDAHASVNFRAPGSAAITATATSTVLELGTLTQAYWDNNEVPMRELDIAVQVYASDAASADETYKLEVEVSFDSAFTAPFVVASQTITRGTAPSLNFCVDLDSVAALGVMKYIRIKATLGGTTPSLTYAAWMVKADAT